MTDLTELILERERNLAYFEKQLNQMEGSDLYNKEKEELSQKFTSKIKEIKELLDMNYKQLKQEEKDTIFYSNPFGAWRVTTEGDEEGRSTEELGTYVGYLDFIAYHLAGRELYGLCFRKVPIRPYILPIKTKQTTDLVEVDVQLDIDSGTWDNNDYRLRFFNNLLKDREHVIIKESNYYASVKLMIDPKTNVYKRMTGESLLPKELS